MAFVGGRKEVITILLWEMADESGMQLLVEVADLSSSPLDSWLRSG